MRRDGGEIPPAGHLSIARACGRRKLCEMEPSIAAKLMTSKQVETSVKKKLRRANAPPCHATPP